MKSIAELREEIQRWRSLEKRIQDTHELIQLGDESLMAELTQEYNGIQADLHELEIQPCWAANTIAAMPC